ncbi:Hsp33 family molecular chaperone HslO [Larsenimonas suaedae]|uniref:33 kDa chaperonin n=1 Tax=Larsenimonas suaedae TaxID=1851019 RepID=A0ABU1GWF5_9GAMM|nr:Hsp33 family molecular chaperone HslO [Larsenimonas suaedae]MCM2972948.1 Hsp33 family molecular chaperone HslO [Larsenimonas suaedae]MDR5896385.1 Hsp33 family molecular chaperone HslO [Larsenimonas suaedae]
MDHIQRFIFDNTDVRGEVVTLEDTFSNVIARHDYPAPIERQLGELLGAVALLTSTIKLDGVVSLEVRGSGPATLLMAESNPGLEGNAQTLRAIARFDEQAELSEAPSLAELVGEGHIVITLDPREGKRYQGIVQLEHDTLAECLETYFAQSEQLPTRLWLEADQARAGGILLQKLPEDGRTDDPDAWNRTVKLAETVKRDELLMLEPKELLYRLYHEETTRIFDPFPVEFGCTCSRERFASALLNLGEDELRATIEAQHQIDTQCHFCNTHYHFSAADVEQLIDAPDAPPPTVH